MKVRQGLKEVGKLQQLLWLPCRAAAAAICLAWRERGVRVRA